MAWSLNSLLVLLCYLALLHTDFVFAEDRPCTTYSGGNFYNLNPLKSSKDYELKTPGGTKITLNVCQSVNSESWNLRNPERVAGFTRRDHGDFSIGSTNATVTVRNGHPVLTWTEGSDCEDMGKMKGSTAISFICDTSVYAAGKPQLVAQIPPDDRTACAYFIEWRTPFACPTSESGGLWGFVLFLVLTFFFLLALYAITSTLYNRYVLDLRGIDQVPEFSVVAFKDYLFRVFDVTMGLLERFGWTSSGSNPGPNSTSGRNAGRGGGGLNYSSHHWQGTGERAPQQADLPTWSGNGRNPEPGRFARTGTTGSGRRAAPNSASTATTPRDEEALIGTPSPLAPVPNPSITSTQTPAARSQSSQASFQIDSEDDEDDEEELIEVNDRKALPPAPAPKPTASRAGIDTEGVIRL